MRYVIVGAALVATTGAIHLHLWRNGYRHISEIAFAWGFNDLSHFGRVFREHFGMSPREFRQSQLRH